MCAQEEHSPTQIGLRIGRPAFSAKNLPQSEAFPQLIRTLCHEIENPLTAIISLATVLERLGSESISGDSSDIDTPSYPRSIISEAWRVSNLVEKLRLLIATPTDDPPPCELNIVLCSVLAKVRERECYDAIDVQLKTPEQSPTICVDPSQFAALLTEVFRNAHLAVIEEDAAAVKDDFQLPTPPVTIEVSEHDGQARVIVSSVRRARCTKDLGCLFEPFVTGDETKKKVGLGLTAAWAIVERYNGTIELHETPLEKGFRFATVVTFPMGVPKFHSKRGPTVDQPKPPSSPTSNLPSNVAVLVIEDEPMVASAIRKILEVSLGQHTSLDCLCVSGKQAIELIEQGKRFNAVLCDLNLKEMTGKEIFEIITKRFSNQLDVFAFLTGDRRGADTEIFLKSSNRPFLYKPFEAEQLLELVTNLIAKSQ